MKSKDACSLGKKAMTNLDSISKSRDITVPTKVCLVKAMVFPEVMYGCESWITKKADHWRTDAFELWCWRRLLRVPWMTRRSNQSILKEISPEYSLEGLMLKLKLQYFGHLMQRTDSLEKILMLGKTEDRGWDGWMTSLTQWLWVWASSRSWWWTGKPGVLQSMGLKRVGLNWTDWSAFGFQGPVSTGHWDVGGSGWAITVIGDVRGDPGEDRHRHTKGAVQSIFQTETDLQTWRTNLRFPGDMGGRRRDLK